MADINLPIGATKTKAFGLKDAVTNVPITGSYANLQFNNNTNPTSATFQADSAAPNPNSAVKATPISVGIGSVDISVQVTYTDPGDGLVKTETKTLTKTFEVIGTPHGANLELIFQ